MFLEVLCALTNPPSEIKFDVAVGIAGLWLGIAGVLGGFLVSVYFYNKAKRIADCSEQARVLFEKEASTILRQIEMVQETNTQMQEQLSFGAARDRLGIEDYFQFWPDNCEKPSDTDIPHISYYCIDARNVTGNHITLKPGKEKENLLFRVIDSGANFEGDKRHLVVKHKNSATTYPIRKHEYGFYSAAIAVPDDWPEASFVLQLLLEDMALPVRNRNTHELVICIAG